MPQNLLATLSAPRTILCIGAHCDDIEIGCGGSLMRLADEHPGAQFVWAVFAGEPGREVETRAAAAALFPPGRAPTLEFHAFRGSYFPAQYGDIKDAVEGLKRFAPDLVFTHHLDDRHQDHAILAELTWNTFRAHQVFEYEIAKYEGDLGHPNCFFPLTESVLEKKIAVLMEHFPSQRSRSWFTPDTFRALARIRGVECNAPEKFAEAFHVRKFCL
jgi:LmbE family N-acetylglucosaminyl deacetylase